MRRFLNLDTFPIDQPESAAYIALVDRCRIDLEKHGMFNLDGFLKPEIAKQVAEELTPLSLNSSFTHKRAHNIYFLKKIPGLDNNHPALRQFETVNHTLCGDQIEDSPVMDIYRYQPLINFLADVMGKPNLHAMDDAMACANVMTYRDGEALNWHFDRSEFTTTMLLQKPESGGVFQYRTGLRTDDDPNYQGVAGFLNGDDTKMQSMDVVPGTLNVFRGKNTAHRVSKVEGKRDRMIAVFCYYENPGVSFSNEDRMGFYGRTS